MIIYNKKYNKEKSYCKIALLFPRFIISNFAYNINGDLIKSIKIAIPTHFVLNSNKVYVSISISIFGFGFQFQIHE